jgi:hypothetical protein
MIENQLLAAYPEVVRAELLIAVKTAYELAEKDKGNFLSFQGRALGYLRHFWSDALLEKTAVRLNWNHKIGYNKAGNTPHISIFSNNWHLTPHHLGKDGSRVVPAKYRDHYSGTNDMFHGGSLQGITSFGGYVQFLHSGTPREIRGSLYIPSSSGQNLYSEVLDVKTLLSSSSAEEVPTEEITDELANQIKVWTENQINNNKV